MAKKYSIPGVVRSRITHLRLVSTEKRWSWKSLVKSFGTLSDDMQIVIDPARFGRTKYAMRAIVNRALAQREYFDPCPVPASVRYTTDGKIVVLTGRTSLVRVRNK